MAVLNARVLPARTLALALAAAPLAAGLAVPPPTETRAAKPSANTPHKPGKAAAAAPSAAEPTSEVPAAAPRSGRSPQELLQLPADARISDAETEALAKSAMASNDPKEGEAVLLRLQKHHFKSSTARERELALFVQGVLEDRGGRATQAATTFHKLELGWPQSSYLAEGQVVMAASAVEHKRWQEAESRLHKALAADIPAEAQRRAQELLLWCLTEQGRASEGAAIVEGLKPLGTARPSERGLVGILEAVCAVRNREQADAMRKDYHRLYPAGAYLLRVDLDWAKLLGALGEAKGAAQRFHALIQEHPDKQNGIE